MFIVKSESSSFTCANKHDVVLSVSCADPVHGDLREAVVHVSSDKGGPSVHGVHGVVHERVVTGKLDDIIRETFSGFKAAESLTGTLKENSVKVYCYSHICMSFYMYIFKAKRHKHYSNWCFLLLLPYHSWAGIGHFSLEGDPLVVGPLFVSERSQEGPPDVIHGVEAHG